MKRFLFVTISLVLGLLFSVQVNAASASTTINLTAYVPPKVVAQTTTLAPSNGSAHVNSICFDHLNHPVKLSSANQSIRSLYYNGQRVHAQELLLTRGDAACGKQPIVLHGVDGSENEVTITAI